MDTELAQTLQANDIEGLEFESENQQLMVMIDKLKKHIKDNFLMASFYMGLTVFLRSIVNV